MLRMVMQSGVMPSIIPQFLQFCMGQIMLVAWACGTFQWEAGFKPAISESVTTFTTLHFLYNLAQ